MFKMGVVGDVAIDLVKKTENKSVTKDYEEDNWELYFGNAMELRGGSMLLFEMIDEILALNNKKENAFFIYDEALIKENSKEFLHTIITLNKFKSAIDDKNCKENSDKYRVEKFDGFNFPSAGKRKKDLEMKWIKGKESTLDLKKHAKNLDMVLIHDHGNYFRDIENSLKKILGKTSDKAVFIHKMRYPLAEGELWDEIQKATQETPEPAIKNLIIIINVDDLRETGLRVSRTLSWERTASDLRSGIEKVKKDEIKNESLKRLLEIKNLNLIVRFETDGAILYQNKADENKADENKADENKADENKADENKADENKYTLFFDPNVQEGTIEHKYPGNMKSLFIAFVAGLVLGIENHQEEIESGLKDGINDGIKNGLIASRELYKYGFINQDNKINYPFEDIFKNINNKTDSIHAVEIEDNENKWKIVDKILDKDSDKDSFYKAACQYVKFGKSNKLKTPIAQYGKLRTADKSEIESYNSLKNLINEYLNKKNVDKPLSIAVFGPPGSGKSFGVTEISKSISNDVKKLQFNLSQFQSPNDLLSAFHMVQSTLLRGKIPLVFFDEFDSTLNNEDYGWLKYFLSPMNDGEFKQGDTIHPIGKCIFVFAGGTSESFEKFNPSKNVKGPDFKSRLRGYVNIKGINMKTHVNRGFKTVAGDKLLIDNDFKIRRAMVLRNVLEKNAPSIFEDQGNKKIAQIDDSVLNALINVPEYKHGNRSMEAIIEMSVLSSRKRFERSALPSAEQLELHVDTEKFKEYLNKPNDCDCKKIQK